eukprot:CAMPEP_0206033432 /NCGR_PEP_ID=MMETSP1466-20131121/647_1 /ASSEMBLY_ACC=CAM_ASM_001126 /TAXON_ID=44452 /ORGANISM="Pavlova gyrans, Strain CCMP608" /LENGTH=77 /DNA_ID=CAMNT_0053407625 /DNA_START=333 /DNA_END=562 /DNA_ORIENTATION=-
MYGVATLLKPGIHAHVLRMVADGLKGDSQGGLELDVNVLNLDDCLARTMDEYDALADRNPHVREVEKKITNLNEQKA